MAENFIPLQLQTFVNDTSAVNAVNNNFAAIATLLNDVLSRSGVTPNQMNSTLDMNGNQMINLPFPSTLNSPARLADVTSAQNITIVTATTGTSGHVVPFLDGTNTWSAPQTIGVSGANTAFTVNNTLSGSFGGSLAANTFSTTDNINLSSNSGTCLTVIDQFGGSGTQGARVGLLSLTTQTATTSASNPNRTYAAVVGTMTTNANDNGTNPAAFGTSAGTYAGGNFQFVCNSSATALKVVNGLEANTQMASGSSTWAKALIILTGASSDGAVGTQINAMQWMFNQGSSAPWSYGILIDNFGGNGFFPLASSGTVLKTIGGTITAGIDLTSTNFTGSAFGSPGFSVTGAGAITSGAAGVSNGTLQLFGQTSGNLTLTASTTANLLTVSQPLQVGTIGVVPGVITIAGATSGAATLQATATGGTLQLGAGNVTIDTSGNIGTTSTIRGAVGVTIPTGGNSTMALYLSSSQFGIYGGTGNPTVSAAKGSLYLENGTGQLWLNTSGSTTWTQVTVP